MFVIVATVLLILSGEPERQRYEGPEHFDSSDACELFRASDDNEASVKELRTYVMLRFEVAVVLIRTDCEPAGTDI